MHVQTRLQPSSREFSPLSATSLTRFAPFQRCALDCCTTTTTVLFFEMWSIPFGVALLAGAALARLPRPPQDPTGSSPRHMSPQSCKLMQDEQILANSDEACLSLIVDSSALPWSSERSKSLITPPRPTGASPSVTNVWASIKRTVALGTHGIGVCWHE